MISMISKCSFMFVSVCGSQGVNRYETGLSMSISNKTMIIFNLSPVYPSSCHRLYVIFLPLRLSTYAYGGVQLLRQNGNPWKQENLVMT